MSSSPGIALPADDTSDAPSVPPRFSVHDESSANWLVRRVVEARAYRDRVKQWAERELRRSEREESFFLSRHGCELDAWLRSRLATERGRRRSVNLPAGTVSYRRQPAKLVVVDEPQVVAWATNAYPDALETVVRQRLRRRVLTQHLEQTGELPPDGATFQSASDRLYIL